MRKKEQTIEACKTMPAKYRSGKGIFFTETHCPLCKIHCARHDCLGCPLANESGESGCMCFSSYRDAFYAGTESEDTWTAVEEKLDAFGKRAQFFEKIIPILETLPAERFTRKGWKYTGDLIPREW